MHMSVNDIIRDQDEMKTHQHPFVLWTRRWADFNNIDTVRWDTCRLIPAEKVLIPVDSGVYSIVVQPKIANHPLCSYLMYIGKTKSLRRRFGDYLNEKDRETGRPKMLRLLNKYEGYIWFCYSIVDELRITKVEEDLITAYMPPANDQMPAKLRAAKGAF